MGYRSTITRSLVTATFLVGFASTTAAETIFLSTQARPVEEATKIRDEVLKSAPVKVHYIAEDEGAFTIRVKAESEAGKVSVNLLGALHGQFTPLDPYLDTLDDVLEELTDRGLAEAFVALGKFGAEEQKYIPWMQATYIMAANKKALQYLPQGVDINDLTYDDLLAWGKAIHAATGERRLGFPAGPKGLLHRFFQGYLYPAYTSSVVTKFRSPEAVTMWESYRELWTYVNPRSTAYDFMQEPLLAEEVWVAFDHTARLLDALNQRPDDFVTFPAPRGPKGLGFMPVVAGLAIPKGTTDRAQAVEVIKYLTQPEVQVATLKAIGFFPVVAAEVGDDLPAGVKLAAAAVSAQAASPHANPGLLPVGLGDQAGLFNKVFQDSFQLIILRGADIKSTLDRQAEVLRGIMTETGAPCWAPDLPSAGACPVD